MNDVRKMIFGTIGLFFLVVVFWISIVYVSSCGLTLACQQARPKFVGTTIPTLIPHSANDMSMNNESAATEFNKCEVSAADLVGAWVTAGSPETDPFPFTDIKGNACEGTYSPDVQPLFVENSLWYKSAIGCVSCHNSAFTERSAGLDLTTYQAILKGSGRADENATGKDILGGGNWESSALYQVLVKQGFAPAGHSAAASPVTLIIYAGQSTAQQTTTVP